MFNLLGNIEQVPYTTDKSLRVIFRSRRVKVEGHYGGQTWWFPMSLLGFPFYGESGLKIRNTIPYFLKEDAEKEGSKLFDLAKGLRERLNEAKIFIPEVYSYDIIRHRGEYLRGGKLFVGGTNFDSYYPAIEVELFEMVERVPRDVMTKIRNAFHKDGFSPRFDSFVPFNIGKKNNRYAILDIADQEGTKIL